VPFKMPEPILEWICEGRKLDLYELLELFGLDEDEDPAVADVMIIRWRADYPNIKEYSEEVMDKLRKLINEKEMLLYKVSLEGRLIGEEGSSVGSTNYQPNADYQDLDKAEDEEEDDKLNLVGDVSISMREIVDKMSNSDEATKEIYRSLFASEIVSGAEEYEKLIEKIKSAVMRSFSKLPTKPHGWKISEVVSATYKTLEEERSKDPLLKRFLSLPRMNVCEVIVYVIVRRMQDSLSLNKKKLVVRRKLNG